MLVRKIIHVDMDAFYASVEQRDDPSLAGRPVAVGHAGSRGVVAAASYEARAFGVRSAMPSMIALRRCPQLVFVRPRFDVYRAVSCQLHGIFADYTTLVEPLALDEAYLDVTQNCRGLPSATITAKDIRARILQATGLTASAGVSYNKFLAKLASGERKPNGQFVITPDRGQAFVASLPVARFHGVGPVTAAKMQRLGIETGADLREWSLADLQPHFGKSAAWYLRIASGEDDRPVQANRMRKSSGAETTFARDLTTVADIEQGVAAMAEEVWGWCERTRTFGRTVTVKVKFADFHQVTRSRTYRTMIAGHDLLRQACLERIRTLLPTDRGVRLLGVAVSNFAPDFKPPADATDTLPLFDSEARYSAADRTTRTSLAAVVGDAGLPADACTGEDDGTAAAAQHFLQPQNRASDRSPRVACRSRHYEPRPERFR